MLPIKTTLSAAVPWFWIKLFSPESEVLVDDSEKFNPLEDKSDCSSENNDSLTNYQDNSKFTNLAATQTMSLRYSETVETVLVK